MIFSVATIHAKANDELLKTRIAELFPSDHYEIGRGQWLVFFPGTAQELYVKLAPPADDNPYPLTGTTVFGISGYFGVASRDMWDWMATKLKTAKSA